MSHFTVKIPCKPYVKAYLENNCGTPVDLRRMRELMEEFRRRLSKTKDENRYEATESAVIIIPVNYFSRYGWELKDVKGFNSIIEHRIKFFMRSYVSFNNGFGVPTSECIREFQEKFGFPDPIWSYESIKKDFDRNGRKINLKTVKLLKTELMDIMKADLSEVRVSAEFQSE